MEFSLDLNLIFNTVIAFALALFVKFLLDFKLALYIVKYLHFLPVRSFFRVKPVVLNGAWNQRWDVESANFSEENARQSFSSIRQFGSYCYSEFESNKSIYVLFGRLDRDQLIGEWFDMNDPLGYSGSFHFIIKNQHHMEGMWIGNSKTIVAVKSGTWRWTKQRDSS
ncbi:hypothetical protein ACRN9V_14820 [Shewanella baltica]|uniref:hypothetical protein n=1 Tax=Shewanella baltica TaxID=62322 RepID=UPI003D7B2F6A